MANTIYTGTVYNRAKYIARGLKPIDVTVKGGHPLGPTWAMVNKVKAGGSEAEYTKQYMVILQAALQSELDKVAQDKVVLMCYCKPTQFCHRFLLVDYLVEQFGIQYGGEV